LPETPVVVTMAAFGVTQTGATLAGTIDPGGAAASCHFEYGPTTAYGSTAPCSVDPGQGTAPVAEHADLSGLSPGSTYHYRLVGTNAGGSASGADLSFTTASPPPPVVPPSTQPPPPTSTPKPPALKCKKGFRKAKVRGKVRCVKKKRKRKHR
jgi:hypothetical protein